MILKGSQRADGRQLAAHLLKTTDNEHVELHEQRGFLSHDLHSAFLADIKDRNPLNLDREEWQQAKRAGLNPKDIKRVFQDCWAISDSS